MTDQQIQELAKKIFDIPDTEKMPTGEQVALLNAKAADVKTLAELAFGEKNKTAWNLIQDGVFELPIFKVSSGFKNKSRYNPFFRGSTLAAGIRDIVWEVEESHLPQLTPDKDYVGEEAAAFLEQAFRDRALTNHPIFKYIGETDFTKEQERAAVLSYMHSVMVRIRTVHRGIMLVQIPMEFEDCVKLAPLCIDELGEADIERAHAMRTARDIEKWGDTVDWHAPVTSTPMRAMLNWNLRTITHPDSLWSFCGIFCIEWNSYLELRAALLALRKRGIADDMMDCLVAHGEGEPYDTDKHAYLVRQELGRRIETPEDCARIYSGIDYHQKLYHNFFEGEFANLKRDVEAASK